MTGHPAPTAPAGDDLGCALGYTFKHPALLTEALTHRSAIGSARPAKRRRRATAPGHYERLEFLGERVLGLVIADLLWRRFDTEPEGELTLRLTHLVQRETLARVALQLGLDRHLVLSPAEAAAGAARSPAILADCCEAVIGAVYADGGLAAASDFIRRWWEPLIAAEAPPRDPKTALQEWAQARGLGLPRYCLVETSGPDHAPRFTVAAQVAELEAASATASSKRAAEAGAAAALMQRLGGGNG